MENNVDFHGKCCNSEEAKCAEKEIIESMRC